MSSYIKLFVLVLSILFLGTIFVSSKALGATTFATSLSLKSVNPANTAQSTLPVTIQWVDAGSETGYTVWGQGSSLYPVGTGFGNPNAWIILKDLPANTLTYTDSTMTYSFTRVYIVQATFSNSTKTNTNQLTVRTLADPNSTSSGGTFGGATGGTGTCTDRIKNGNETGIDTGGRCGSSGGTTPTVGAVQGIVKLSTGGNISISTGRKLKLYLIADSKYYATDISGTGSYSLSNVPTGFYFPHIIDEPATSGAGVRKYYIPSNSTTSLVNITAGQTATFSDSSLKLY